VCADKDLRKDLSKVLGLELGRLYLDVDELLDYEVLKYQHLTLSQAGEALHKIQHDCINRALEFKNCIITISHDLFVSNDNFDLTRDLTKVFVKLSKSYLVAKIKKEDKYKLDQELSLFEQINALIIDNCDIVIEKGAKANSDLCKEIINELEQKKSH